MKVNVVCILFQGSLSPEPEVFQSEKGAEEFIIKHCGKQGKDYIKRANNKMSHEKYGEKYESSDYEIHWYQCEVNK